MFLYDVLRPYGHQSAQTAGLEYLDDPCSPRLSHSASYCVMFSFPLSSLSFPTKPKGNQWTLAKTGQARAQSKQHAKIQSTAHTNKHTKTHWQHMQHLICPDIHMLHIHTDQQSLWRATLLETYWVFSARV